MSILNLEARLVYSSHTQLSLTLLIVSKSVLQESTGGALCKFRVCVEREEDGKCVCKGKLVMLGKQAAGAVVRLPTIHKVLLILLLYIIEL